MVELGRLIHVNVSIFFLKKSLTHIISMFIFRRLKPDHQAVLFFRQARKAAVDFEVGGN